MNSFNSLRIKELTRETNDAVSIAFEVPNDLVNDYTFKAGQYVTLKTNIDGEEVRRAYSICSSITSGDLRVAVKAVPNGVFSTYANTKLNENDYLDVSTPEGKFLIDCDVSNQKNYAAFAAGSGITPILSMITSVLEREPNSTFTLLYGNKSVNDTIFYNQLNDLKNLYEDRFTLIYIFSRAKEPNALTGRIDGNVVKYLTKNRCKDIDFDAFYLCGPEAMINIVSETLLEEGINKEDIYFELFTSTVSEAPEMISGDFNETSLTIIVDDETHEITAKAEKFILDACLDHDLDVPYSCQGGVCSSCIARVKKGKAKMVKNAILTDGEIEEGLILTCQAIAEHPELIIDYDDV